MKRKLTALVSALTLVLVGCGKTADTSSVQDTTEATPATPLTVTFMKVGKADGIILQTANHTVVLDCGEKSDGKKMVARLNEAGVTDIDYLLLSHYDQDHIGGAAKVVENFNIWHVVGVDYSEDSSEFEKLSAAMETAGLHLECPTQEFSFQLDDALFTVYPHESADYQDGFDNNCSLVVKVTHHDETLLFTGDAMQERLSEIMDIGDCDLLKVPYHGREIANLPEFLAAVTPEYGVISTDDENLSAVTMQELADRNVETYVTYQDGNIVAVSDGSSIEISTEGVE